MTISIVENELPYDNHRSYNVTFFDDEILTFVTCSASVVDEWISEVESVHRPLIVGLDVEWRPNFGGGDNNPVATLQLCVGRRCLIFQLIHADKIPQSLASFLAHPDYTFVGVGIGSDVKKLEKDHRLKVGFTVDVRLLAADSYGRRDLRNGGLKSLAREVLGREIQKPKKVTKSSWNNKWLTPRQVQYACIDAFVSFEIGRVLNADRRSCCATTSSSPLSKGQRKRKNKNYKKNKKRRKM